MSKISSVVVGLVLSVLPTWSFAGEGAREGPFEPPPMTVADGFEVELAAAPPLVGYPMLACLDEKGRLYIAESDGQNLEKKGLLEQRPRFVRRLEDVDGDGRFDRSTIFCDSMTMPEGALWRDGALYIVSAPYLWRLEDTDDDGVADKREKLLGYMEFDGRANQHGPYLGPNGRLFFSGGIFGIDLKASDGTSVGGGARTAGVFSCRADGNDVRAFGLGGINPVEVVFSPEGELFSTCAIFDSFQGRHDALVHWVHGGLTTRQYGPVFVPDTGVRLPPVSRWGQVAPAGLMRYRGTAFGPEFTGNLFACQFNTRRVVRVRLERQGSTFSSKDEDFLVSASIDFHPTEILEDADGSLLVIDTGGWLSWGCPFSKIAKPQIRGAIYRIRRVGARDRSDPRGDAIDYGQTSSGRLALLLDDPRPFVRDRARNALVRRGEASVPALSLTATSAPSERARRNAVWTLSVIGSREAQAALREALADESASVRQAAVRSAGTLNDARAVDDLVGKLRSDVPQIRRASATALGQIGESRASSAILESLARDDNDEHLQHAHVRALIDIGDRESVLPGLLSKSPRTRLGALVALDQMSAEALDEKDVAPLLGDGDALVRSEAVAILGRRRWVAPLASRFERWLRLPELDDEAAESVAGIVRSLAEETSIRRLLGAAINADTTPVSTKKALLLALSDGGDRALPDEIARAVATSLESSDEEILWAALEVVAARRVVGAERHLDDLLEREGLPEELSRAVITCLAQRGQSLEDSELALLLAALGPGAFPLERVRISEALTRARLSTTQLGEIVDALATAGPLELPHLLDVFDGEPTESQESQPQEPPISESLALRLVEVLGRAPGTASLSAERVRRLFERLGVGDHPRSRAVVGRLSAGEGDEARAARLDDLEKTLPGGDPVRGEAVFRGSVASCAACHRSRGRGGEIGPDLSRVGAVRGRRDLLEAVLFPSSTIVNGYETWRVITKDGAPHLGVVTSSTRELVEIATGAGTRTRVRRDRIATMEPASVSLMPKGLDETLGRGQLADLMAYLESLK